MKGVWPTFGSYMLFKINTKFLYFQVYYSFSDLSEEKAINITDFNGTCILNSLRPYTVYSIHVTAVRLIGDTGRLLEGMRSTTITERTLAGST